MELVEKDHDSFAKDLRGFGPLGILAAVVIFAGQILAPLSAVLVTSVFFGSLHYLDQGLAGVEQATITGLVFGTIFAVTGRIFVLMVAHAAFDLTAVAIIYWNLESAVAHFVFK